MRILAWLLKAPVIVAALTPARFGTSMEPSVIR